MLYRTLNYMDQYLFSFVHLLIYGIISLSVILNPEQVILLSENAEKLQAILAATLPLSFILDYFRHTDSIPWSIVLGSALLFFILSFFAFRNFRLPIIEYNYYNMLYIMVFFFFTLILVAASYFVTLSQRDAWNQIIYFLYSFGYAMLYATISVAGLLLIIYFIEQGFDMGLRMREFLQISVFLFVVFFEFYFLYIKSDTDQNPIQSYPSPLLIFTSYVLFPLFVILTGIFVVIVYMLLFRGYQGEGWVGYILLSYLILGFAIFFLIFPIRKSEKSYPWVSRYPTLFSYLLIPLGLLIIYDVYVRVAIMDFTEPRYVFFWAGILALFWGIQNRIHGANISLIRMGSALLFILVLLLYGPLNMSSYSNKSQTKGIKRMLDSYELLPDGRLDTVQIAVKPLHPEDKKSLKSKLDYLSHKQYSAYREILPSYQEIWDPYSYYSYRSDAWLMRLISAAPGQMYVSMSQNKETKMTYTYPTDSFQNFAILDNTDYYTNIKTYGNIVEIDYLPISGYQIDLYDYLHSFTDLLKLNNAELEDSNYLYFHDEKNYVFSEKLTGYGDTVDCKLVIEKLAYTTHSDSFDIEDLKAYILY